VCDCLLPDFCFLFWWRFLLLLLSLVVFCCCCFVDCVFDYSYLFLFTCMLVLWKIIVVNVVVFVVVGKLGLKHEECERKMRLLSLVSLACVKKWLAYEDIAKVLSIAEEDVEKWIVQAITKNLLKGKMDQQQEAFIVKFVFFDLVLQCVYWSSCSLCLLIYNCVNIVCFCLFLFVVMVLKTAVNGLFFFAPLLKKNLQSRSNVLRLVLKLKIF